MRKLILLFPFLALAYSSPARASGDVGCTPDLRAFHTDFSGCENMALIAPSNDTRANLAMLLLDLHNRVGAPLSEAPGNEYYNWPKNDWAWPADWQSFSVLLSPTPPPSDDDSQSIAGYDTEGEGTICISDQAGADGFVKAVSADTSIDQSEKDALIDARKNVHCKNDTKQGGDVPALPVLTLHSPAATEFSAYLAAVNKFYGVDRLDPAGFAPLKTASQPWVKEAAIYMEGRVLLLKALQSGLSDYGDVDITKADKTAATAAGDALKAYIDAYPGGAYMNSARGLLRRAYWLSGDPNKQLAAYSDQINETSQAVKGLDTANLVEEIDAKLPADAYKDPKADPLLIAIDLLRDMRPGAADDADDKHLSPADLEKVKDSFKDKPELYLYLQAALAHFVQHDDKAVLALLPDTKPTGNLNYLQFSTAMLRAKASGDPKAYVEIIAAAGSPLQRGNAELAWAMAQERADKLDAVFDADSPVTSPLIRVRLLEFAAGPGLLRKESLNAKRAQPERSLALYTLLYRDLTQGDYKAFADDVKQIPPSAATQKTDDYGKLGNSPPIKDYLWDGKGEGLDCPNISGVAAKLAVAPKDVHSLLCLGEFLRLTMGDEIELATPPNADDLGGAGLKFPGKTFIRQNIYQQVIADAKAGADDKAFALYRAIECYASVGNNHCGGKDVAKSVRKGWYDRLKKEFGKTKWAGEAKYYY